MDKTVNKPVKKYKKSTTERNWELVDKYLERMTKELGQKDMYYIVMQYAERRDSAYWKKIVWDRRTIKDQIRKIGRQDMCTQCMEQAIKIVDGTEQ